MKKNNKGFFLAETIVVLALVTTVMAFVYPNVSKLYDNYNSRILYYDQPEDVLLLKEIYNAYKSDIENQTKGLCGSLTNFVGAKEYNTGEKDNILTSLNGKLGIKKLYLTGYMTTVGDDDYYFNRYLKRMRKVTNDTHSYRLIGVFENGSGVKRYASIKVTLDSYCAVN